MTKRPTASPHPEAAHHPASKPNLSHPHPDHPRSVPIFHDGAAELETDQPFEEGSHDSIDPDLRHRLVSEAAFELYKRRGFADGYDLDDWLQAEEQLDHTLLHAATEAVPETEPRKKRRAAK